MKNTAIRICLKKIRIILFWIAVWQIAAILAGSSLLVASPFEVVCALFRIVGSGSLFFTIFSSMGRILAGMMLALACGILLVAFSYCDSVVEELLQPFMLCVKTVPVASFVVILLIWQDSARLSVWISFLIALPVIYINFLEGLKKTDCRMLEMADVFRMSAWNRFWYIYRPPLVATVTAGMKLVAGMTVKAGVAAEIIGMVSHSFGEKLYLSKIYLNTDELFAWTLIIVLVSFLFEKCILLLVGIFFRLPVPVTRRLSSVKADIRADYPSGTVRLEHIAKSFGSNNILGDFGLLLSPGERIAVIAPSGSGKSTLFRLLAGLEMQDGGNIVTSGSISAVFQDTLLCESADALLNLNLVNGAASDENMRLLKELLGEVDCRKKCANYSGGMKRRVAIGRALCVQSDILLLDEPFASLDADTRKHCADIISEFSKNRTVILFSHSIEEAEMLNCTRIIKKLS